MQTVEHQQLRDVMHRYGAETPAFVCPVRDLPAKDLALLCHYKRCPVLAPPGRPPRTRDKPSINRISAEFVAAMQAALPSTVPTVLRTASKLKVEHLAFQDSHDRALLKLQLPAGLIRGLRKSPFRSCLRGAWVAGYPYDAHGPEQGPLSAGLPMEHTAAILGTW